MSTDFEEAIRHTLDAAASQLQTCWDHFNNAEQLLGSALGLAGWSPPNPPAYVKSASDLKTAGRWDSQFHSPLVDAFLERLAARFTLRSIGELSEVTSGSPVSYADAGGVPIIRSGDLVNLDDDHRFLRADADQPIFYLERGDVLISSIGFGSIGKVQVFDRSERFGTVSEVTVIRQSVLDPYYLAAFLRSRPGQAQIDRWITGATGQLHLYPRDVRRILVPTGNEELQQAMRRGAGNARAARLSAARLFEAAKRAVEIAIEDSEGAALRFLEDAGD